LITPPHWGVLRRRRPRYPLGTVKTAFADPARINRTMSAAEGAEQLGMDEQAVVDVVAGLTAQDFDK
jgi:Motility quorum-sensing regulator, toxin of MqsA